MQDRDNTALTSHHDLFRFTKMQFWLKNTLGTFQHAMDVLFNKVKWQFAAFSLDDIVILSRSPNVHIKHALQLLTILNDVVLTLTLKKSELFTNFVAYVGHII